MADGMSDFSIDPNAFSGGFGDMSLSIPPEFSLPASSSFDLPATGGGGGSSIWDTIGRGISGFGTFARNISPLLGIGTGIMGAVAGARGASQLADQNKLQQQAEQRQADIAKQAQGIATPVAQFGAQELSQATAGKIPAAIQAQIDQWAQAAKAKALDYLARAGIADSSAKEQWMAMIDQQAQAMAASALENEQQIGINAAGTAGNILGTGASAASGAVQTATQQSALIENLIAQANEAQAKLTAGAS